MASLSGKLVLALCLCGGACVGSGAIGGEKFFGGEVKKGSLSVEFSKTGTVEALSLDGVKLARSNGGISTSGSKEDEWKPWAPQSWSKDAVVEKSESPDCVTVTAKGTIVPKGIAGQSSFVTVTKVYADKVTLDCKVSTPTEGLWRRAGGGWQVESDAFGAGSSYRADDGEAKTVPETRGNRNLIYKPTATKIEMSSDKYVLTFKFDGIKACLFDDRKPEAERKVFNVEFGSPAQEISDERGAKSYEVAFTMVVSAAPKK